MSSNKLSISPSSACIHVIGNSGEWKPAIVDDRITKCNFSGAFDIIEGGVAKTVYIKQALYNKPAVVVWWSDGTQTRTKVRGADEYNLESGLIYCILKKISPNTNLDNLCADWTPSQLNMDMQGMYVTMKDVRAKHKVK